MQVMQAMEAQAMVKLAMDTLSTEMQVKAMQAIATIL